MTMAKLSVDDVYNIKVQGELKLVSQSSTQVEEDVKHGIKKEEKNKRSGAFELKDLTVGTIATNISTKNRYVVFDEKDHRIDRS